MHFDECLEITDALGTHAVHQVLDGRKILYPQRNRRMLEQITRIPLAALDSQSALHLGGHVFERDQHTTPRRLMSRNDARTDADIQTPPIQGVIDRLVGKSRRTGPQLRKLVGHLGLHVVPKNLVQVAQQFVLAGCSKSSRVRWLTRSTL